MLVTARARILAVLVIAAATYGLARALSGDARLFAAVAVFVETFLLARGAGKRRPAAFTGAALAAVFAGAAVGVVANAIGPGYPEVQSFARSAWLPALAALLLGAVSLADTRGGDGGDGGDSGDSGAGGAKLKTPASSAPSAPD